MTDSPKDIQAAPAPSEPSGHPESRYWGSATVLESQAYYRINRVEMKPGHRMKTQVHYHRSEHWIVVSGTAKVICGDRESLVIQNQSTYVPPCTPHYIENPGVIPLVMIEVQNGEYLGEEDIVRIEDGDRGS
ncbi:MAG: cupin domain-containing protein [Oscillatoria sp. SIO1A7]|nr:cupin domain-containing protein [Oscillatoria sp. SIO1A7]